jgi:D-alanyl-D-alanine dipeptidase
VIETGLFEWNSAPGLKRHLAGACYTHAANIANEARSLRHILSTALTDAGLINYATEWWHWSYGDRYWALVTVRATTRYGPKNLG